MPILLNSLDATYRATCEALMDKTSPIYFYVSKEFKDQFTASEQALSDAIKNFEKVCKEEGVFDRTFENDITSINDKVSMTKFGAAEQFNYTRSLQREERLRAAYDKLRAATMTVVDPLLGDIKTIDEIKNDTSLSYEERMAAHRVSLESKEVEWNNADLRQKMKRLKETDMEFGHRPRVMKETRDEYGNKRLVPEEIQLTYKDVESKEFRFFNRPNSAIKYDRTKNPDERIAALLILRDIVEDHKEVTQEVERRREYGNFINKNHESFALWQNLVPQEVKKMEAMQENLSSEIRERFNTHMQEYNQAQSFQTGINDFLAKEQTQYARMLKDQADYDQKVVDTGAELADFITKKSENQVRRQNEVKKAEDERNAAAENSQISDDYVNQKNQEFETAMSEETAARNEYLKAEADLNALISQQDEERKMLLDVAGKAAEYRSKIEILSQNLTQENVRAAQEYYQILEQSKGTLGFGLSNCLTFMDRCSEWMQWQQDDLARIDKEYKEAQEKYAEAEKGSSILKEKLDIIDDVKANRKEVFKEIKKTHKNIAKMEKSKTVSAEEAKNLYENAYIMADSGHELGLESYAVYLDDAKYGAFKKDVLDKMQETEQLKKDFEAKEKAYTEMISSQSKTRTNIFERIDDAIKEVQAFEEKLRQLQDVEAKKFENELNEKTLADNKEKQFETDTVETSLKNRLESLNVSISELQKIKEEKLEALTKAQVKTQAASNEIAIIETAKNLVAAKQQALADLQDKHNREIEEEEKIQKELDEKYQDAVQEAKNFTDFMLPYKTDYENLQKLNQEGNLTSERKVKELVEGKEVLTERLTEDAKKQTEYVSHIQREFSREMFKNLTQMLKDMEDVAKPKSFNRSNSKEFTNLKNTLLKYTQEKFEMTDPSDKSKKVSMDNPNCILGELDAVGSGMYKNEQQADVMIKVDAALLEIKAAADAYVKAKGSPFRDTQHGKDRYFLAKSLSLFTAKADRKLVSLNQELAYTKIAPDMSLVTADVSTKQKDFYKSAGYEYTKENYQQKNEYIFGDMNLKNDGVGQAKFDPSKNNPNKSDPIIEGPQAGV